MSRKTHRHRYKYKSVMECGVTFPRIKQTQGFKESSLSVGCFGQCEFTSSTRLVERLKGQMLPSGWKRPMARGLWMALTMAALLSGLHCRGALISLLLHPHPVTPSLLCLFSPIPNTNPGGQPMGIMCAPGGHAPVSSVCLLFPAVQTAVAQTRLWVWLVPGTDLHTSWFVSLVK